MDSTYKKHTYIVHKILYFHNSIARQNQIKGFQKQKYWNVHLHLDDLEVMKEKLFD